VDDQQGPWWTRPPEPGQPVPPVQRRRTSGQQDVDLEYPPNRDESETVAHDEARTEYLPNGYAPPAEPDPYAAPAEPETEPEPPKPAVRRVAVVPPSRPATPAYDRGSSEDRTETLPAVPNEIFATFSGSTPGPTGGPSVTSTTIGAAVPPEEPGRPPAERPNLLHLAQANLPEPRVLLLAGAGALVVLLIVVVALVTGGGPKDAPTTQPPTASAKAGATPEALKGKIPNGLKKVSSADAAAQLREVGAAAGGTIVEAWGWTDKNGQNLVATSISGGNRRTLKVTHLAGLDADPRRLRVMRDPNLPTGCSGGGTAGFTPKSLAVVDLDGDDVAEVVTGWSSRCGGPGTRSQIRLALITNGKKYIIRGQGVIGQSEGGVADPRASNWPTGYYKALAQHYRNLYG